MAMTRRWRRRNLLEAGVALTATAALPRRQVAAGSPLVLNDASGQEAVAVAELRTLAGDDDVVEACRRALADAARNGRPLALGAARHSMGGHSLPPAGLALIMAATAVEPDRAAMTYRTGGGTRWRDVIAGLDPLGGSPAVMQSNHDFGVGATIAVNAHGWPAPFGPCGDTVRAFRLMLADGTVLRCAPDENAELFGLALGGYGLVGIVLDAELAMVPNEWLEATQEVMPAEAFAGRMTTALDGDAAVRMAYGRLSLAAGSFLDEALLVTWRPGAPTAALPAASSGGLVAGVSREIFRAQIGSDRWKDWRWRLEKRFAPAAATRNTLLNEPVAGLRGRDRERTDILHEYFVPPERFPEFLLACRETIPGAGPDLLNVTLRYVAADRRSVLAYAPERRIAAVMLFSQELRPEADAAMHRMTETLIERVLAIGGSYYLPYRPHARPDQLARAYPRLAEFVALKLRYDPRIRFRNRFWDRYLAPIAEGKAP